MKNYTHILKNIPLIRFTSIIVIGVMLGIYLQENIMLFVALTLSVCLLITAFILRKKYSVKNLKNQIKWVSVCLNIALLLSSYSLSSLYNESKRKSHFSNYFQKNNIVKLQIIDEPITKTNSYKLTAKVVEVITDTSTINTCGKIIVYIQQDSLAQTLKYGDILTANALINNVEAPKNPYEFNYKDYLKFHNIYQTTYISSGNWIVQEKNKGNIVLSKIFALRKYLNQVIDTYVSGANEKAIANAILIGKKDLLDTDMVRAYSSSGAMHVLAVSGLHVGIVYLIFNSMLFFLNNRKTKFIKPFILVFLIWFYALLTGASPSVLRAATMFSFIAIGTSLKQYVNIYNVIAASALILIVINPYIITEVGFQLSYLAVFGIIFLQAKIYNLIHINNYLLDKIWTITTVSIAAQIATFPLGLLYFHQFPNFFWISNLIVIPVAFLIVYIGMALFLFSFIPFLAKFLGFLLSKTILILNTCVAFIDQLPYALSSGLHITILETYLIYIFIAAMAFSFIYKNKNALKIALFTLLFLSFSLSFHHIKADKNAYLTVYHVPKQSAIELSNGTSRYSYFDETLQHNESQLLFRIKHNWWGTYTKKQEFLSLENTINNIEFNNKKFLIVDSNYKAPNTVIETDYCILKHQQKLYLSSFVQKVKAEKYIFDSSNKSYYNKYWKKDCDSLNLNCYFVNENSAFVEKL